MSTTSQKLPQPLLETLENSKQASEVKLTLKELVKAAEISERTIRYYIQEGILPSPQGAGSASWYSIEHLTRLSLIRRFKSALLPLSQIKQLVTELTPDELEQIAAQFHIDLEHSHPVMEDKNLVRQMQSGSYFSLIEAEGKRRKDEPIEVFCPPAETEIEPKIEEKVTDPTLINFAGRWNRIALAPGLELHYQEGGPQDTSEARERLAHLVELAMRLYF